MEALGGSIACVVGFMLASTVVAETKNITWTGWFSDERCASARAAGGTFRATNPECAKTCINKGAAPVFISEQAKAVFKIKNYPSVLDDLGYHIELTGAIDEKERIISVETVKRLSYKGAACTRPKKTNPQQ